MSSSSAARPTGAAVPPRSLADQLRGWSDQQLAGLLTARPDLATPAPQDSSQLASRAGTRASVQLAADRLTLLELTVVDALLALGGTASPSALREVVNAAPDAVDGALDRLRGLARVWGTDRSVRARSALHEAVGTRVSGLGPSAAIPLGGYGPTRVAALARDLGVGSSGDQTEDVAAITRVLADPDRVGDLIAEVGPRARAILDHLDREGREGSVESTERAVSRAVADGPVDRLLARGLLVARDRRHVVVPREVAICLRGGHTTREPVDVAPALATATRDPALVDRTAAGAAFDLVRRVELLLEHWGSSPPSALSSGGLGVRDLRAAAELLHTDERDTALHVHIAQAAGLLAVGEGPDEASAWLPTDAFDTWQAAPVAQRWVRLAQAWLGSSRLTGPAGGRDGGRPANALSLDLERGWLPGARRAALDQVAALERGSVLDPGAGVASLVDRLGWLRPRRSSAEAQAVAWAVEEAAVVGLVGLGGMSGHGRTLLDTGAPGPAAAALEPLLPAPVTHVLLQADLTAVAPGPLEQQLARQLATVADVESRGGATVYRFSESSVRRAFDSGWSAAEVHALLADSSRTPVPQALSYLVDDVSRRFGTVRVGTAEAFLRSDDEAALTELAHHPRAASLGLRRIAPTVLVSDVPVEVILPLLRELGSAAVLESPDGTVRLARREVLRSRTPRRPGAERAGPRADGRADSRVDGRAGSRRAAQVTATVAAIRAGDRAAAARPATGLRAAEPATPAGTLASLREAVESGSSVWLAYLDNHGATLERVVDPVRVEAGWLSAYDHRSTDVRSFAVHRITAVRHLDG